MELDQGLLKVVNRACQAFSNAVAVEGDGILLTYSELSRAADKVAGAIISSGSGANEPVIVMVSNQPSDWAAFLGTWRATCVVVPIHRTTPALVVIRLAETTGARFIVDLEEEAASITRNQFPLRQRLLDGHVAVLASPAPPFRPMLNNAALIIFTSGSTGRPKGVVLSHKALAGKLEAINGILEFSRTSRILLVLQINFSFGIWVSFLTLISGGTLVVHKKFDPNLVVRTLLEKKITTIAMVPTMMRLLFAQTGETNIRHLLDRIGKARHLRQLLSGGESLEAALAVHIKDEFVSAALYDIYGLTETATSDFILCSDQQTQFCETIGSPSPGVRYRIADSAGLVEKGEIGELQILTPFIMNGYLDEPELTQNAFQDGYFRTGDLVRLRENELIQFIGRTKELISRAANKISPVEIEHVFLEHPGIAQVLVTGVPNASVGEHIHILIVPRMDERLDESELKVWASTRIDKFKLPDVFHFGRTLPLGRTGKADRSRLRDLILSGNRLIDVIG